MQLIGKYLKKKVNRLSIPIRGVDFFFLWLLFLYFYLFPICSGHLMAVPQVCPPGVWGDLGGQQTVVAFAAWPQGEEANCFQQLFQHKNRSSEKEKLT